MMNITKTDTSIPLAPVLPIPDSTATAVTAVAAVREVLSLTSAATALTGAHGAGTLMGLARDVLASLSPADVIEVALTLMAELRDQIIVANTARLEATPF